MYSKTGEKGKYTLRKTTANTSCKLRAYYNSETDEPYTYYYKVRAYKKINGKLIYSKYSEVISGAAGTKNWTIDKLEDDIISYLMKEGYTVKKENSGDEYHQTARPTASGKYYQEYENVLKQVKKDILEEVKEIKACYETEDKHMESHTLIIGVEVVDSVNPYGISLDGADVYITDESNNEYNYLLSEEQITQYRKEILKLINIGRAKAGLSAVTLNNVLSEMAQVKVEEFEELNYWDHISPVYGTTTEMAKTFGITDKGCYEILERGAETPKEAVEDWMNSEGHRNVILNAGKWGKYPFAQVGIGVYATKQTGYIFWAVEFIQ